MKKILLPCFMFLISTNALAKHAYRSESCTSTTHNLVYKGNYPLGGMYGISLKDLPQEELDTPALPLFDGETAATLNDAEVIFNQTDYKITEDSGEVDDCGFDHSAWTSEQTIEISLISSEASKILGLKAGDKITFICEETSDFPNGKDCEE